MLKDLNPLQRIMAIAAGLMLLLPSTATDIVGLALFGVTAAWQLMSKKVKI
jgi:TRAP-type uncharacterized transport system fused permease subunit